VFDKKIHNEKFKGEKSSEGEKSKTRKKKPRWQPNIYQDTGKIVGRHIGSG